MNSSCSLSAVGPGRGWIRVAGIGLVGEGAVGEGPDEELGALEAMVEEGRLGGLAGLVRSCLGAWSIRLLALYFIGVNDGLQHAAPRLHPC